VAAQSLSSSAAARLRSELTHAGPALLAQLNELSEQEQLLRVNLAAVLADVQLKQALGGDPTQGQEKP
jgi:hypothetical protein